MIASIIQWFSKESILLCDARCNKAWGIENRPRRQLSLEEDDFVYFSDDELGDAPEDPGTTEKGQSKPTNVNERLNQWCCWECERSFTVLHGQENKHFALPDLSKPRPNYLSRR